MLKSILSELHSDKNPPPPPPPTPRKKKKTPVMKGLGILDSKGVELIPSHDPWRLFRALVRIYAEFNLLKS